MRPKNAQDACRVHPALLFALDISHFERFKVLWGVGIVLNTFKEV